jgi:hypothetical protein
MVHDGKKRIEKPHNKNFNHKITMDLNDKIWTLFSKVLILVIFCWIDIFPLNMYVQELSKWTGFFMEFIS